MIAAVVLAAGSARRFGRQKLLADLGGKTVVRHVVEHVLASPVDEVVVVLGSDAAAVGAALDGLPVRPVINPRAADGMATSIVCGVGAVTPAARAILIALGDQPGVDPGIIERLIEAWRRTGKAIAAPEYLGTQGTPVLFDAALRPELLALTGDRGARALVMADAARVATVVLPFPTPPDVDTPDALEAARRHWAARRRPIDPGA